jgi:hypothetical protein
VSLLSFCRSAPHGAERALKLIIRINFLKPHDARARPRVRVPEVLSFTPLFRSVPESLCGRGFLVEMQYGRIILEVPLAFYPNQREDHAISSERGLL